jgi:hypothetical protein
MPVVSAVRGSCTEFTVPTEQMHAARNNLNMAMAVVAGVALGGAAWGMTIDRDSTQISLYFLAVQDLPALVLFGLFFAGLAAVLGSRLAVALPSIKPQHEFRLTWITLVAGCCIVWVGARVVYLNFGLSADEFMAEFDARIISSGRLLASVAPDWRAYVPALQPIFRLELPDNTAWVSSYLPMNAAIRAVFVLLGDPAWEGVVLAGVAIIAVFAVARRLWPDRPDAAVVGIILLVCSSQFLITAMTPYAMTAHLALNMVWLWLFLRDTRASHGMAAGVAFVACGLHQVVFHPLFAAPFLVALVLARRWKLATYYAAVYGVIGLFWILYWSFLLHVANGPAAPSAHAGMLDFIHRVLVMIDVSPAGFLLMGLNLLRFLAWQSPLLMPLALVGLFAARARNAAVVRLAAGIVLTLGVVLVLMPFQGHGWGYRYLHGLLGSLSLMAAQGWIQVTERESRMARTPALALSSSVLLSLFVLLPWRASQVHGFVAPYASATQAIQHAGAEVVLVDPTAIWYGQDLVRNDPFLHTPPKVLGLWKLDEARLSELCRRYDVAIFDQADAGRIGMRVVPSMPVMAEHDSELRTLARSLGCGRPVIAHR